MKKVQITPEIERVSELFSEAGYRLYVVGQYVRNTLLALESTEIHITSEAEVPDAARILKDGGMRLLSAEDAGRAAFFETESTDILYIYTSLAEGRISADAADRDFTVNALYLDAETGEIYDPTGCGLEDIEERKLRACSADIHNAIERDVNMLMRMSRLEAELGFEPEEELFQAVKERAYVLRQASKEKLSDELVKILLSDVKYGRADAVERGLFSMLKTGVLFVLFPPFVDAQCIGYGMHHKYSVMTHSIKTCAAAPPDLILRFAGLLHDIGKPAAMARDGHMKAHGVLGEAISEELLREIAMPEDFVKKVSKLVGGHMFNIDNSMTDEQLKLGIQRYGVETTRRISALRRADLAGAGMGDPTDSADSIDRVLEYMLNEHECPDC